MHPLLRPRKREGQTWHGARILRKTNGKNRPLCYLLRGAAGQMRRQCEGWLAAPLWVLFWAHHLLAVFSPRAVTSPVFGVRLGTLTFLARNSLRALLREGATVRILPRQLMGGHV